MAKIFREHAVAFKNEAEVEEELAEEGKTLEEAENEFFED